MKAANSKFENPKVASPTPTPSTASVPTKFCQMMRRQRRAIRRVAEGQRAGLVENDGFYPAQNLKV
ncbi:MAG TPA: hypothetical protein VH575_16120 [Gemmataceae bacterium]